MLILRLLAVVTILLVAGGVVGYFMTGNQRYLRFSWRVFITAAAIALAAFALLAIERMAVIPLPV
ncbi:MAG TPA: hypothetical protein VIS73_05435 [Rhodocyclaceae bacterium]